MVDAATGNVLEADNPDAPRHPASLAKLMTLYMTFEALRDRRITLDTLVPVSAHAASMEPTKLGLVPGMPLTVQQAILGLVTKSANDAASALGELLGGSEDRFAQMMTLRARALGMAAHHLHQRLRPARPEPVDHGARHGGAGPPPDLPISRTTTTISARPASCSSGVTIYNHDTCCGPIRAPTA